MVVGLNHQVYANSLNCTVTNILAKTQKGKTRKACENRRHPILQCFDGFYKQKLYFLKC